MKLLKYWILLLVSVTLTLTLCACGGEDRETGFQLDEGATLSVIYEKIEGKEEYRVKTWGIGVMNAREIVISSTCNGLPVTEIADGAFAERNSLITLKIPKSIQRIGTDAFADCKWLNHVYYEGTVADWCQMTFDGSPMVNGANFYPEYAEESLSQLVIPEGITSIPERAFMGMKGCGELIFPSSLTTIHDYAFSKAGILQLSIPSTLTNIERYAFFESKVYSLVFLEGVTEVPHYAFQGSTVLDSVRFEGSGVAIGQGAFSGCTALKNVNLNGVRWVGIEAFDGCSSLIYLTIPESVECIDYRAFHGSCLDEAYFKDPSGWLVGAELVKEAHLSDSENAAKLLTRGFVNHTWTKTK